MSDQSSARCNQCGAGEDSRSLQKCPICFKWFCDEHQHNMSGRTFCSAQCAEYFFFADPDDSDE